MEAVKEAVKSANGASEKIGFQGVEPDNTPENVMRQIAELLRINGYEGLGVVAIGPRGSAVNPLEFLPTGDWRLQIVPVKNGGV